MRVICAVACQDSHSLHYSTEGASKGACAHDARGEARLHREELLVSNGLPGFSFTLRATDS